ncbi:DUF1223 domain-containing protein [Marimonas arenosa]|uniref:DUF1223 domain-containing protein n=1 Tax=Marimonas arenosa TaxID=1795305 RepID=A0AAE4B5M0_9RHOB|nr:DUF1223 domain-containing protein [Marimonas arenosa]MDQ2091312.1 DUF1223 domain-containing protein [Marimonas arenosa]
MMRLLRGLTAFWVMLGSAGLAQGAEKPVIVVELFTSQGCSSCPPADAFLHELAKRDDVVALSLHVDYWDYIGWKDVFAQRKFTQRQHGYAKAGHRRSVYTPQMIIHGQDHVVGNHPMDVTDLIASYQERAQPVALRVARQGGEVIVEAQGGAKSGTIVVQLVRFEPAATVDIRRGENAGHSYTYANVVRHWDVIGEWDGAAPFTLKTRVKDDLPAAVILQRKGFGPILAAARVE